MRCAPQYPRTRPEGSVRLSYRSPRPDIYTVFPACREELLRKLLHTPRDKWYHFPIWKSHAADHGSQSTEHSILYYKACSATQS